MSEFIGSFARSLSLYLFHDAVHIEQLQQEALNMNLLGKMHQQTLDFAEERDALHAYIVDMKTQLDASEQRWEDSQFQYQTLQIELSEAKTTIVMQSNQLKALDRQLENQQEKTTVMERQLRSTAQKMGSIGEGIVNARSLKHQLITNEQRVALVEEKEVTLKVCFMYVNSKLHSIEQ